MNPTNSKELYNEVYNPSTANYGAVGQDVNERFNPQLNMINLYIQNFNIHSEAFVLEVGCGLGRLHSCHPNWHGIEYSATAVQEAKKLFGESPNITEGDARKLPVESNSVDLYFSFAALEHVPEVERAFIEIERVIRGGGGRNIKSCLELSALDCKET